MRIGVLLTCAAVVTALMSAPATAQIGGGVVVCSNCASEVSQLKNTAIQLDSYAKQALILEQNILQYQAMIKHLQENPLGAVLPNLGLLVTNANRILANGTDIANNMSKVDNNIVRAFKNPQGDFGVKFKLWVNSNMEALTGAMLNAGLAREQFADDQQALQALVIKNQASVGDLGALKTLGEFAAAQLQESHKLRDLITTQQLAVNTQLMAATAKESAEKEMADKHFKVYTPGTTSFSSSGGRK